MVRRRTVIRLEKQRKSENRFSSVKWNVHINLGKRNYRTKDMLGAYQDMQAISNKVNKILERENKR
ncbi:hypothetical protein CON65_02510 [Bacillus pseudomycoides]|uniref:Uncharacterized protein n=2 Tax=Bacillaceae TaxID=186817 RepID=A0AA91ZVF8_9BACI|nr:hypothetical protein CON65_02510 [Bacillus pseudomycoides]PEU08687.1 hypothetical protein CN525_25740 [Bacillus sp. AFS014408]PEU15952.1 hypothetical protein CN524_06215 [Bacillus sp. AFS019443]PFW65053.1 hypothetical protein COL20_02345 [Bacillus sp. AFS075034]